MKTALERFNSKWKADENGCHVWTAAKKRGYGQFYFESRPWPAHRWALQFVAGVQLIDGLQCDHLCNNPSCVNTSHLRQCTALENSMATHSATHARLKSEQTHCIRGHELSGENLSMKTNGTRRCRACRTIHKKEWRARRKAAQL